MNEQNLIDRLRNAAHAQSFAREAQDEMFELISEEQCQQCCQRRERAEDERASDKQGQPADQGGRPSRQ